MSSVRRADSLPHVSSVIDCRREPLPPYMVVDEVFSRGRVYTLCITLGTKAPLLIDAAQGLAWFGTWDAVVGEGVRALHFMTQPDREGVTCH